MGRVATSLRHGPAARAELDELTLRRAQQGERAALDQLVERYHPMVHALVWRMACARGDSHVADLVQDSLIRVLQAIAVPHESNVRATAPTKQELPALDRPAIQSTMQALRPQLTRCGQLWQATTTLQVRVKVARDGSVIAVSIDDTTEVELAGCVRSVLARAKFPQNRDGGAFSYPLVF